MYKIYLTALALLFSVALACNNSAKSDKDYGETEVNDKVSTKTAADGKEEIRNQAINLKKKINSKTEAIDSLLVDSDTSGLQSTREALVKEASEMDSVIYKVVNASDENWDDLHGSLKKELAEAEEVLSEVDQL